MVKSMKEMTGDLSKKYNNELLRASGEQLAKNFMNKKLPIASVGLTTATVVTYGSKVKNPNNDIKKKKKGR